MKGNIEGLRYGVKWISGYSFYIGRIYCIDIKSDSGQVIKIRLKSIYRIRRKLLSSKYVKIVNSLFAYYFNDIARSYLKLFRENTPFEILGVDFTVQGICFDKGDILPWEFVGTKSYWRYYALFSEVDHKRYKAFEFLDHWNACILRRVTEEILKIRFPQRKREPQEGVL